MIDPKEARRYAENWIEAWNSHDIDRIMDFYAESICHITPKLTMLFGSVSDAIKDKDELRDFFLAALKRSPELHFTLTDVFAGAESIVICFDSTTGIYVAVVLILDEHRKITRYMAHYRNR
jgi:hypothetical protein